MRQPQYLNSPDNESRSCPLCREVRSVRSGLRTSVLPQVQLFHEFETQLMGYFSHQKYLCSKVL